MPVNQAWPFLVGRNRTTDYIVVVIPAFMRGQVALEVALRGRTGGRPSPSGAAYLLELRRAPQEPVTAVYRVVLAQPQDYGLRGDGKLTDSGGRPILLTEGIVLRHSARDVRAAGIAESDLDQAHRLLAPSYRAFWSHDNQFQQHAVEPFELGGPAIGQTTRILDLGPSDDSLDDPAPSEQAIEAGAPQDQSHGDYPRPRSYLRTTALAGSAIVLCVTIAIGTVTAIRLLHHTSTATPRQAMTRVCEALRAGSPSRAYAQTTKRFRHDTSKAQFTAELLPGSATAASHCGYVATGDPRGNVTRATLTISSASQLTRSWLITLIKQQDGRWQISAITAKHSR